MIDLAKYSPIQAINYPGFYIIPTIDNYVINIHGDVLNIITNQIVSESYNNGYIRNSICNKMVYNHRLVCLAFYGIPSFEQTQVNHKDGIKYSNYFKNLEWCTSNENRQHAYIFGLSKKDLSEVPVYAYNIHSKEVVSGKSYVDLGKKLNICGKSIIDRNYNSMERPPHPSIFKKVSTIKYCYS